MGEKYAHAFIVDLSMEEYDAFSAEAEERQMSKEQLIEGFIHEIIEKNRQKQRASLQTTDRQETDHHPFIWDAFPSQQNTGDMDWDSDS